jgi:hypothetical protein
MGRVLRRGFFVECRVKERGLKWYGDIILVKRITDQEHTCRLETFAHLREFKLPQCITDTIETITYGDINMEVGKV